MGKDTSPMADLTLHAVQWCAHHGHPVLALRTTDDRYFIVSITAEEAGALAFLPAAVATELTPRRLYGLVEAAVSALEGSVTEVRLHVGGDNMIRASLHLRGPAGERVVPAHFADGVAIAQRGRLPLRMADEDLARVPLAPLAVTAPSAPTPAPPTAFASLIASLDLDGLGGDDAAPGAPDRLA
jgi:bifunctional DNase/RNase